MRWNEVITILRSYGIECEKTILNKSMNRWQIKLRLVYPYKSGAMENKYTIPLYGENPPVSSHLIRVLTDKYNLPADWWKPKS